MQNTHIHFCDCFVNGDILRIVECEVTIFPEVLRLQSPLLYLDYIF